MRKQNKLSDKALQALVNMNRSFNNGDLEFIGSQFWKSEMISSFDPARGIASGSQNAVNTYGGNFYLLNL